jgi:hypothetical protein
VTKGTIMMMQNAAVDVERPRMTDLEAATELPRVRQRVEGRYRALRSVERAPYQVYDRRHEQALHEAGGKPVAEQVQAWLRFEGWLAEFETRGDHAALKLAEDARATVAAHQPAAGFNAVGFVLALRSRGVVIDSPDRGRIIVNPRSGLNSTDEDLLRQHREAILHVLNDWAER